MTFRAPLITRTWSKDPSNTAAVTAQDAVWQNLQNSLFVPFAGVIGNQKNEIFPNPNRGAVPSIDLRTWINSTPIQLYLFGHLNFDWPNPRGYIPATDLKTWLQPLQLNILGKDQFFGLGGSPNFDWPNPRGAVPASDLRTFIMPGTSEETAPANAPRNYLNFDWPNPRGYIPATDLKTWTWPVQLNLFGQDKVFGLGGIPNFDWPNPRGAVPASDLRTYLQSATFELSVGSTPINSLNFDWPNPRGYTPVIDLKTWLWPLQLNILGTDQFFGLAGAPNFDWPNPRGAVPVIDLKTFTLSTSVSLTAIPSVLANYLNFDWPNPRGAVPSIDLRTWINTLDLDTLGQDFFFGLAGNPNFDWPNPRGAVPASDLRTWIDLLKPNLVGKDKFFGAFGQPPANLDWPVPKGYTAVITQRTWLWPSQTQLVGKDSFFGLAGSPNFDWPNPRAPGVAPDIRNWTRTSPISLTISFIPPIGLKFDWPNPRGYVPGISLGTWLDALKLELLGKDLFFGTFGQPPANLDWPNPKGAIPSIDLRTYIQQIPLVSVPPGVPPPPIIIAPPPAGGGKRRPWPGIPADPYTEPSKAPKKIVPVWDRKPEAPKVPPVVGPPAPLPLPPASLFGTPKLAGGSTPMPDLTHLAPQGNMIDFSQKLRTAQDRTDEQDIHNILKALGLL